MKTRNAIVLSGITMLLLAMFVNLHVAVADEEPVEGGPGDDLQVYFLKKTFDFCNDAPSGILADMPGGAVPDGMDVQTAGCVDRWTSDVGEFAQDRKDNYAFTGEQIAELVVARDLDGAIAITHAILQVEGCDVAYCNDVTADYLHLLHAIATDDPCDNPFDADWFGPFWCRGDRQIYWRNHEVDKLLKEYPPQKSEATEAGFDEDYDKLFECILTVTDDHDGLSAITVEVYDSVNDLYAVTDDQMWFFNPEVSLDISLSSGSVIEFEDGYAGDTVYSLNKLMLENAAEGGVDIAVWLGGTDLTSPDMAAKCPWSNILDVEGVDGWDGMEFRCTLDGGIYVEQCWQQVENKNIKEDCDEVSEADDDEKCLGLRPLFADDEECWDAVGHDNVLENGHEAECSFKLQYPVPCIGEFTDGNLIIIMRAI